MAFLRPRRAPNGKLSPFHALIVVGVLVVAAVLGVQRLFQGDDIPTADVPAVEWEDVAAGSVAVDSSDPPSEEEANEDIAVDEPAPGTSRVVDEPIVEEEASMPTSFNLALPFTSQAPFGVWDAVHEDTCEEASILMVAEYFAGASGKLDANAADAEMRNLVAYEDAHGYGYSVSAAELKAIIEDYDDGAYTAEIIEDPSADDLRALLVDGYPVIIPAAGRMLGNPFFTGAGPLYHMLVLRGYDDGNFITNDPGTRHGENYTYDETVLMNAIADWTGDDIDTTQKRIVVMRPVE